MIIVNKKSELEEGVAYVILALAYHDAYSDEQDTILNQVFIANGDPKIPIDMRFYRVDQSNRKSIYLRDGFIARKIENYGKNIETKT